MVRIYASICLIAFGSGCTQELDIPYRNAFDVQQSQSDWHFANEGKHKPQWQILDGSLKQTVELGVVPNDGVFDRIYHLGSTAFLGGSDSLTDFSFGVDVTLASELGHECGVVWRASAPKTYYRLTLNYRDGISLLQLRNGDVWKTLSSSGVTPAPFISTRYEVHTIGADMFVKRNGTTLFAASNPDLSRGAVGLYARGRCQFDNLSITSPTSEPEIAIIGASTQAKNSAIRLSTLMLNPPEDAELRIKIDSTQCIGERKMTQAIGFCDTTRASLDAVLTASLTKDRQEYAATQTSLAKLNAKKIIAVGDSNTNGWGDDFEGDNQNTAGQHFSRQGYPVTLEQQLYETQGQIYEINNLGIAGEWTAHLKGRLASIVEQHPKADTVLLMIGTNDIINKQPSGLNCRRESCSGSYAEHLQTIIDEFADSNRTVWLAHTPPIFGDLEGQFFTNPLQHEQNQLVRDYNQVIKTHITNYKSGPDFYDFFLGEKDRRFLFSDSFHPNALGHAIMAASWHQALTGQRYNTPFLFEGIEVNATTLDNNAPYQLNLLEPGDRFFIDENSELTNIPRELATASWLMTANAHRNSAIDNFIELELGDSLVDIFVVFPKTDSSIPHWLSTWETTQHEVHTSHPNVEKMSVYKLGNQSGSIRLGGAEDAPTNYIIAFLPGSKA